MVDEKMQEISLTRGPWGNETVLVLQNEDGLLHENRLAFFRSIATIEEKFWIVWLILLKGVGYDSN